MTLPSSRLRLVAAAAGLGLVATAASVAVVESASALGLDTSYGTAGLVRIDASVGGSDRFQANAAGANDAVFHAGYTTVSGTNRALVVAKTTAAGALDQSFGTGGVAVIDVAPGPFASGVTGAAEQARGVAVRPNGKVLVLGQAETLQNAADPADVDVYVAQLNADGTPDQTFGTAGATRVDLSSGKNGATVGRDQAGYNITVRPDGKVIFTASQGLDGTADAARTDREIAAVQLTENGLLDTGFSGDGIATTVNSTVSENPRRGFVDTQGRYVTSSYGAPTGGTAQPWIYRFNADGTLDATFGTAGIATATPAGAAPAFAEAYAVLPQGNKYVIAGYGTKAGETEHEADAIVYRFDQTGALDTTFGTGGITAINRVNPDKPAGGYDFADRARGLAVLPDGRIVTAGLSGPDALAVVLTPNGQPDTSVSPTGTFLFDLGGDADSLWGVSVVDGGKSVVMSGYGSVAANTAADASAVVKLNLTAKTTPAQARAASATSVKLVKRKVTTKKKAVVKVKVVAAGRVPTGTIKVLDGVKVIKTVTLSSSSRGAATVTLPKLKKGKHRITVKYYGSSTVKDSKSATVVLTVVRPG